MNLIFIVLERASYENYNVRFNFPHKLYSPEY